MAAGFVATAAWGQATVQVLPGRPTSAERIEFLVDGAADMCWPAALFLDAPAIAGEVVTLGARTPPGPLPPSCSPGWPQRFELASLPAGSYSAEFRLDGVLRGAAAFEVAEPGFELLLQDGLLGVSASFVDPRTGVESLANGVALGDQSGFFWFFSPSNVELTVKVLDGRAINGAYWLFIASMTDVAYTVEVARLDVVCVTAPCASRRYQAPAGENRNFIDTGLFQ